MKPGHNERLEPEKAIELLKNAGLWALGRAAHELRLKKNPPDRVSYIVDTNINYTNVCVSRCAFCAFWRPENHRQAYLMSPEEWDRALENAARAGITTVLLQGGLNPRVGLEYMTELVRRARNHPVHLHGFSPPEIAFVAEKEGMSTAEVLAELWAAGLRTIPGGGAEILSERIRKQQSPNKVSAEGWIEIMREAHEMGFKTTATMMFGHGETPGEIVAHLDALRRLQDETGGFTAFIAWDFKPRNTRLKDLPPASPHLYLRTLALARIYLDNFPHIQASWSSQGKKVGQIALWFGADDMGSLLVQENVMRAAGHRITASEEEIRALIEAAGFRPARRDTFYNIIE